MKIKIFETKYNIQEATTEKDARILIYTIREKGKTTFIVATSKSQFEFLQNLTSISFINWPKITMFHLDEYVGLPETHSASFRKCLKERLINKVYLGNVYLIKGDAKSPELEC